MSAAVRCACECAVNHPGQQTGPCVPAPPLQPPTWICPPCRNAIRVAASWAAASVNQAKLTEQRADAWGEPYTEVWACDPPARGVAYTVVRQEWNATWSVRTILEIKLAA